MMLSSVDLPQPLGPMIATISFCAIVRLMSRTASTISSCFRNVFETCRRSIMPRPLDNRSLVAAIDVDIGADDESRTAGGKKSDRVGNIFGRSPMAERHLSTPFRLLLLKAPAVVDFVVKRKSIGERALDTARAHRIDENIARRELVGQRFDESMLGSVDGRGRYRICLREVAMLGEDNDKTDNTTRAHDRCNVTRQLPGAKHFGLKMAQQPLR